MSNEEAKNANRNKKNKLVSRLPGAGLGSSSSTSNNIGKNPTVNIGYRDMVNNHIDAHSVNVPKEVWKSPVVEKARRSVISVSDLLKSDDDKKNELAALVRSSAPTKVVMPEKTGVIRPGSTAQMINRSLVSTTNANRPHSTPTTIVEKSIGMPRISDSATTMTVNRTSVVTCVSSIASTSGTEHAKTMQARSLDAAKAKYDALVKAVTLNAVRKVWLFFECQFSTLIGPGLVHGVEILEFYKKCKFSYKDSVG